MISAHKSGSRHSVESYRHIAKSRPLYLSCLNDSTLLRLHIYQHGFLKGKSTATNLLELTCHIFKIFFIGSPTDVLYAAFSNIFDLVGNKLVILKLQFSVFTYWMSRLLSYFYNRSSREPVRLLVIYRVHQLSPFGS